MSDVVIRVENIGKLYRIGQREHYKTLRDVLTDALFVSFRRLRDNSKFKVRNPNSEYIWALKDVSFEVKQGEVVGIIGRNGAGKSTLLKILSCITEPTEGYAETRGRVRSLLEVGTGFHPELTGRENICLNGAILGMKKTEIDHKFDEIVAFAEVEKFIDTPVKYYSSGMYVRLAFAVAAHLEPEILLVDEVLAVGDIVFQKKCLGKMEEVAKGGRTVLFISHNMQAIGSLCTQCICFENGRIIDSGSVASVVANYLRSFEVTSDDEVISDDKRRHEAIGITDVLRVTNVSVMNSRGEKKRVLFFKEPFSVRLVFEVTQPINGVRLGLGICTPDGLRISTTHHTDGGLEPLNLKKGRYCITAHVQNHLTPGDYVLIVGAHEVKNKQGLEHVPIAARITVVDFSGDTTDIYNPWNIGLTNLRVEWADVIPDLL